MGHFGDPKLIPRINTVRKQLMTNTSSNNQADYLSQVLQATNTLKEKLKWSQLAHHPKIAIVLGSGLGTFSEALQNKVVVPYTDIPHMPASKVPGHAGRWVCGQTQQGHPVLVAQGRIHYYEGHDYPTVTLPIRIMKELGITHVTLTNAAGSVNLNFLPGDFMLLSDHINLTGESSLRGLFGEKLGPQFVDMSEPYVRRINSAILDICKKQKPDLRIHQGVYCGLTGPNYETPTEVRMLGKLGADAVGMSTVPECLVAKQAGLKVSAVSCITNLGCGLSDQPLHHEEVGDMAKKRAPDFCWVLEQMVQLISQEPYQGHCKPQF